MDTSTEPLAEFNTGTLSIKAFALRAELREILEKIWNKTWVRAKPAPSSPLSPPSCWC